MPTFNDDDQSSVAAFLAIFDENEHIALNRNASDWRILNFEYLTPTRRRLARTLWPSVRGAVERIFAEVPPNFDVDIEYDTLEIDGCRLRRINITPTCCGIEVGVDRDALDEALDDALGDWLDRMRWLEAADTLRSIATGDRIMDGDSKLVAEVTISLLRRTAREPALFTTLNNLEKMVGLTENSH